MPKSALCTCVLLTLGLHSASAWFWPFKTQPAVEFDHANVTALTTDTFEAKALREDDRFYFAKFYATWCECATAHCKTLAPVWGQLAAENTDSRVEFVQVDCTANRKLCEKAAVRGYPDVKVFYNGRIGLAMRGGKDLKGMRTFVKEAIPTVLENHKKALEHEASEKMKADAPSDAKEL